MHCKNTKNNRSSLINLLNIYLRFMQFYVCDALENLIWNVKINKRFGREMPTAYIQAIQPWLCMLIKFPWAYSACWQHEAKELCRSPKKRDTQPSHTRAELFYCLTLNRQSFRPFFERLLVYQRAESCQGALMKIYDRNICTTMMLICLFISHEAMLHEDNISVNTFLCKRFSDDKSEGEKSYDNCNTFSGLQLLSHEIFSREIFILTPKSFSVFNSQVQ